MKGLDVITRRLFGISLEPVDVAPGEVWGEGIQKLEVVHEEEGLLGVLYCDFWARSGKNSHPSHYNIRSGRTLPDGSYQTPIVGLVCPVFKGSVCGLPVMCLRPCLDRCVGFVKQH